MTSQSESIAELSAALASAQSEIKSAIAESPGVHGAKYANLDKCWEAIRGPLTKYGLSISQTFEWEEKIGTLLVTTLHHKSGEWKTGRIPLYATRQDPQSIGSAISYMRRYSLAAMIGLSQKDDDAEIHAPSSKEEDTGSIRVISEPQVKRAWAIAKAAGWTKSDVEELLKERNIGSVNEIPVDRYNAFCNYIQTNAPRPQEDDGLPGL